MSFLIAVKIFADLCLYFGLVGGAFPWFGDTKMFLLWPALLCAGGVWLGAMGETRPVLRFVGLIPPLASLLLAGRLSDFLLLAPALIYTVIILLLGRFELNREQYQTFFARSLWAAGVLGLLILTYPASDWQHLVFFLCLYLLLGFFLLQQLRLTQDGWCSRCLNMLSLVATIAFGGVLCLTAWLVLHLWDPVWNVVSYILVQIVYAVVFLLKFLPSLGSPAPQEFELPTISTDVNLERLKGRVSPVTGQMLTIIGIVLAVLIAVLVIWRLLKTMRKARPVFERMGRGERIDVQPDKPFSLFSTNRDKVRRSYRKFMQLLLERGIKLKQADTTAEIRSSASFLQNTDPADQLRDLYLTARYDEETKVTNQQAKEAKELVKTLSRDPELLGGER